MKLNENKPYGIYSEGPNSYFGQDGRIFNMQTLEEVVRPGTAATPEQPQERPTEEVGVCKVCGKEYKCGPTEKTKAIAIARLKAHLEKEHGIDTENKEGTDG